MTSPGTQIGPYTVDRELGRGGMGVVYAGHDPRLERAVAIKSLPPEFAGDEALRTRFEREAKALAGLSHPNIAAVYGLEEQGGARYMVMELVDGETLTARLSAGRFAVDDALGVCAQVSAAIEAAHERGVIHRDIKPGNIMIAPDGKVKVLDFGLARQVEGRKTGTRAAIDLTVRASPATQVGKVVGTPGYMSPEQCRGKQLDKRTDIWSLGCVLYECLCGEMAFGGETESDCVAAVLEREPDWTKLPDRTPVRVRELVKHCLEKDPSRRMRDAGDARLELERAISGREWTTTGAMTAATGRMPGSGRWVKLGIGAAVLAALGAGAGWLAAKRGAVAAGPAQVFHVSVPVPAKPTFGWLVGISPDARFLLYRVTAEVSPESDAPDGLVMMRRLDRNETKPIEGTEGAKNACLSPDGRWLAFLAARDRAATRLSLKKVALAEGLAAGPAATLCEDVADNSDVCWASDRELVITSDAPEPTILAVSSDGGPTRVVVREPGEKGFRGWGLGSALPGGREVLMTHWELAGRTVKEQVEVVDLATGTRKTVLSNASGGRYLPSGHLIAVRNSSTLVAAHFDRSKMETTGGAVAIQGGMGTRSAPASASGVLAFVSRPPGALNRRLAWVDERGQATPIPGVARAFMNPAVSPDGVRIVCAMDTPDQTELPQELWVLEVGRGTMSRLPTQGFPTGAIWSRDGQRITYSTIDAEQTASIWERKADGTGAPVRLYTSPGTRTFLGPGQWSPDGSTLSFYVFDIGSPQGDGWLLKRPEGSGAWAAVPYLNSSANEGAPMFSPDGKWACYTSDKSGRPEGYARRFTGSAEEDARTEQIQVSTGGTWDMWWSADGKEIRYIDLDGTVMSVKVQIEPAFSAATPTKLYSIKELKNQGRTFAADGRLLVVLPGEGEQPTRIDLVLNFVDELTRKMGAAGAR